MRRFAILILLIGLTVTFANAQFPTRIPKVRIPKVKKPKPENTPQPSNNSTQNNQPNNSASNNANSQFGNSQNRQMVMDDGYTFFDAEPVEEYDKKISLYKDIGWYLKSDLRMLGTFPKRSAFKVVVKKNGKALTETRCEGNIYRKADDSSLRTEMLRNGKDLNYEDFMFSSRCYNEEAVVKPTGQMDVEIHFIDGDTDAEKLVRTYKIDVHRASRVRGSTTNPQPDVAHYYIQRHAESAVAFLHVTGNHSGRGRNSTKNYFLNVPSTLGTPSFGQVNILFGYSPGRSTKNLGSPFARCSVNGQRIKLDRDSVSYGAVGRQEYAIYTDRIATQYKRGSAYRDDVRFRVYSMSLPLYAGESKYSKPPMKIENHPGKWECQVIANGVKFRTFRWQVGNDGNIVPHAEQKNGNINLYYKTYLIDMEIPAGGAPFDTRLIPMPNAGLFYGIPWTSAEGKSMAGRVPRVGNPFHIPSNKAK